ncbi:hypothetical protein N9576_00280 [bacterium]|jgi:hypothetical protein|nr:hypothetical protein [bacterium]
MKIFDSIKKWDKQTTEKLNNLGNGMSSKEKTLNEMSTNELLIEQIKISKNIKSNVQFFAWIMIIAFLISLFISL